MSSIRIVPQKEITASAGVIPPLLLPNLKHLYRNRAERLLKLAEQHPLADYLKFVATIAQAQQNALLALPLQLTLSEHLLEKHKNAPLSFKHVVRSAHWQLLFEHIITELQENAPDHVQPVLENMLKLSSSEREQLADYLLAGDYSKVSSDKSLFLWAALSVYWAQLAALLPGKAKAEIGEQRHFCPVCESAPVASIIHMASENGLRYLHCSLCESEWHMVRIKCSNCEQSRDLGYWSLDSEQAAIKAESCGDCGSYLKVFYQEKDPYLDVVADDLASLVLDAKMEEENFLRSGINPYLFPGEA